MSTVSRRAVLLLMASSVGTALLTACASQAPAAPTRPAATSAPPAAKPAESKPSEAARPAATGQPRSGGTLRVGALGDIQNLEPHITGLNTDTIYHVWDKLIDYDPKLQPKPRLAESWDFSSDYRQLKLVLRKGVQFHSGRELTADDVVWNLNRARTDPAVAGTGFPNLISRISSTETPDKYTLIFKSERPWPGAFNLFTTLNIADPREMQDGDTHTKAGGTGPFKFVEWVQGDHITLTKNPNYWQSGKPYLDGITFSLYSDPQAMVTALESGALDAANLPPLRDTVRLQKDPKYTVTFNQTTSNKHVMAMMTARPPTDNKQFRQAMQYALDRQRIVETVLLGVGKPSQIPFTPSSPGYNEAKDNFYPFDLDQAKSLVAASGIASPTLDFNYATTSAEWARIGQLFQADLAKIGVTLTLKPTETVALSASLRARSYNGIYTGSSFFTGLHPAYIDGNPHYTAQANNWAAFNSPRLSELMVGLIEESDPVKAKQVYDAFSDYLLDECWNIVVATNPSRIVSTAKVHGLEYSVVETMLANDAWIEA